MTVSAYCLWAFERASQVHPGHDPIWFQLTIIPFVIALLHVLRLLDSGAGAAPEELALARPPPPDLRGLLGRSSSPSGPTPDERAGPRHPRELLTGWGRTARRASADVVHAVHPGIVDDAMAARSRRPHGRPARRGLVARGLGRCYGDAAQNAGGTFLHSTCLDRTALASSGSARPSSGWESGSLRPMRAPRRPGLFPLALPGPATSPSVGAIASDIHEAPSRRRVVLRPRATLLLTAPGGTRRLAPVEPPTSSGRPPAAWV